MNAVVFFGLCISLVRELENERAHNQSQESRKRNEEDFLVDVKGKLRFDEHENEDCEALHKVEDRVWEDVVFKLKAQDLI